jgi:hypothetical protein
MGVCVKWVGFEFARNGWAYYLLQCIYFRCKLEKDTNLNEERGTRKALDFGLSFRDILFWNFSVTKCLRSKKE